MEKQKIKRINLEKKDIKESILVNLENEFNFILETMDRIKTNTNDNYSYVRLNTILLEAVIKNEYRQINDFELLTRVKKLIIELDKINRQLDFKKCYKNNQSCFINDIHDET